MPIAISPADQGLEEYWEEIEKIILTPKKKEGIQSDDDSTKTLTDTLKAIQTELIKQAYNHQETTKSINTNITIITTKARQLNNDELLTEAENLQTVIQNFTKELTGIQITTPELIDSLTSLLTSSEDTDGNKQKKINILFEQLSYKKATLEYIQKLTPAIQTKLDEIITTINTAPSNHNYATEITKLQYLLRSTAPFNIFKLNHSSKKQKLSTILGDYNFARKKAKLAAPLNSNSTMPMETNATPKELITPFGSVWVKLSSHDKSRIIYMDEKCETKPPTYENMCATLDNTLTQRTEEHPDPPTPTALITPILDYISQPLENNTQSTSKPEKTPPNLSSIKHDQPTPDTLTQEARDAAAFLCGVLLLSESHEVRNPTGGTFERKAMKNVLHLAETGRDNPFTTVFGNQMTRYLPAGAMKMNDSKLIIEGTVNKKTAQAILQNFVKLEYKNLLRTYAPCLLQDDTNLKKDPFGGKSSLQITNFKEPKPYARLNSFIQNAHNIADIPKNALKNLETVTYFLAKKLRTYAEDYTFKLTDFPEPVQHMITQETLQINKLMNNSL